MTDSPQDNENKYKNAFEKLLRDLDGAKNHCPSLSNPEWECPDAEMSCYDCLKKWALGAWAYSEGPVLVPSLLEMWEKHRVEVSWWSTEVDAVAPSEVEIIQCHRCHLAVPIRDNRPWEPFLLPVASDKWVCQSCYNLGYKRAYPVGG
jgi:hypothetical protein